MEINSIGGAKYFIIFIDDYSRYLSIYFLNNKSEALDAFKTYKKYLEKKTGEQILALRSDNGREFVNQEFVSFLREEGIQHQLTIPYTPQQNGLAETHTTHGRPRTSDTCPQMSLLCPSISYVHRTS